MALILPFISGLLSYQAPELECRIILHCLFVAGMVSVRIEPVSLQDDTSGRTKPVFGLLDHRGGCIVRSWAEKNNTAGPALSARRAA